MVALHDGVYKSGLPLQGLLLRPLLLLQPRGGEPLLPREALLLLQHPRRGGVGALPHVGPLEDLCRGRQLYMQLYP